MSPKLGEILLRAGVIDDFQLRSALGEQQRWGGRLGITLIKLGFLEERDLVRALASQLALPVAHLEGKRIEPDVLAMVPAETAEQSMCLPLFVREEGGVQTLFLGMEDPSDLAVLDELRFRTGMALKPVLMGPSEICEGIDRFYHRASEGGDERRAPRLEPPAAERPRIRGERELALEVSTEGDSTEELKLDQPAPPAPDRDLAPEPKGPTDPTPARPGGGEAAPGAVTVEPSPAAPEPALASPAAVAPEPPVAAPEPAAPGPVVATPAPEAPEPSVASPAAAAPGGSPVSEPEATRAPAAPPVSGPDLAAGATAASASARPARSPSGEPSTRTLVRALGQLLVEKGVLTQAELRERVAALQRAGGGSS